MLCVDADDISSQRNAYNDHFSRYRNINDVECIKITRSQRINDQYKKSLMEFINVFNNNFSEKYSERLEQNLHTIKIAKRSKLFRKKKDKSISGTYNSNKNEIILYEDDSFPHELFHVSSSLITPASKSWLENYDFIGFRDGFMGKGLNEGYTQLLSERFFDTEKTYIRLVEIVKVLEYIIGEEKMRDFYFDIGLKGLIDEMVKYFKQDDYYCIENLITNTNKLCVRNIGKEADYLVVQIYGTLFNLYANKLVDEVNNDLIDGKTALANYDSLWYKVTSKYSNDKYFKLDKEQFFEYDKCIKEMNERIHRARNKIVVNNFYYEREKTRIRS